MSIRSILSLLFGCRKPVMYDNAMDAGLRYNPAQSGSASITSSETTELNNWVLNGVTSGTIYAKMVSDNCDKYMVYLYSDSSRTQLVAQSNYVQINNTMTITAQNSSGISGTCQKTSSETYVWGPVYNFTLTVSAGVSIPESGRQSGRYV